MVDRGASKYVIYHAPSAPSSVKLAAQELQRIVEKAAGAKLLIVTMPADRMICLGDNVGSRKAGFSAEQIPDEGFRIVSKGNDIFILGNDWADDEKKWDGCDSTGTLFGTYVFLEDVVGVRWLMPGPVGEEIPDHSDGLKIVPIDKSDAPAVPSRVLSCSPRNHPDVAIWLRRRRIGRSFMPSAAHSFSDHPPTTVLEAHPEFMPLRPDGTREKPIGNRAWGSYEHKLCLSNPGLIDAFADDINAHFDAKPKQHCASMSPADGGAWCVCPDCENYVLRDTSGAWGNFPPYGASRTPQVIHFYNSVARRVARKHPDRLVGGLAYQDYLYPPYDRTPLEPNVYIGIALNGGYGFKFYKPEVIARANGIIRGWGAVCKNIGWSDHSTWMRNPSGAPLPVGLPIIKSVFDALNGSVKSVHFVAQEAWGYGAANNYVLAHMLWNPGADAEAHYREFLERAYGPAAPIMARLYDLVEQRLHRYIVARPYPDHEIWYNEVKEIYAPIYAELEDLYFQALGRAATEGQRKRLEMFGDNLTMLNWNLRHAALLSDAQTTRLYRSDADYDRWLAEQKGSLAIVDLEVYERFRWQTATWGPEQRNVAVLSIPAGISAPTLDGVLDDDAWKTSAVVGQFRRSSLRRDEIGRQTEVHLAYDQENLYVAFECAEDDPAKVRSDCKIPNSAAILKDDVAELILVPGHGAAIGFTFNATGTVRVDRKAAAQAAGRVGKTAWTVEATIPFKELGLAAPPVGQTWRGNFARRRVGPPVEVSTWSRVEERTSDPRGFGELRFGR